MACRREMSVHKKGSKFKSSTLCLEHGAQIKDLQHLLRAINANVLIMTYIDFYVWCQNIVLLACYFSDSSLVRAKLY